MRTGAVNSLQVDGLLFGLDSQDFGVEDDRVSPTFESKPVVDDIDDVVVKRAVLNSSWNLIDDLGSVWVDMVNVSSVLVFGLV